MTSRLPWTLPLVLALAACGGGDGGPTTPAANRAPTVSVVQNPGGAAIVGVTTLTFNAAAIDPDGDALTCTWNLGDGASRTGASAARSYATAGTFAVSVTCTDGRGGSTAASGTVVARTLEGAWLPLQNGVAGDRAEITQDGALLNGYADNSCCRHTFNAQLAHPRAATFQFRFAGCKKNDTPMTGTVSADLNRIDLTGTNCNVEQTTFAFVRQ
jgi:PKD domain-containing protein